MLDLVDGVLHEHLTPYEVYDAHEIVVAAVAAWCVVESSPELGRAWYQDRGGASEAGDAGRVARVHLASLDPKERSTRLILEWLSRMFEYHGQTKAQPIERVREPLAKPTPQQSKQAADSIAQTAQGMAVDDAIDFFALLAVRWARRCNLDGFDPFDPDPNGAGYHLPQGTSREEWIAQYLLWCFEERCAGGR